MNKISILRLFTSLTLLCAVVQGAWADSSFDGGGHTLTFNHTATEAEGDVAPFRFVRSATICNLHVAGEINTAFRHAAGLSARTYGTTLIRNCRVRAQTPTTGAAS